VVLIEKAPLQELAFTVRQNKFHDQKIAIAKVAATLVEDGYSIALDSSTTVYALVPFLKQYEKLTIMTNSLILAQGFLDHPSSQVLLPGGRLRRDSISLVGQAESLPHVNLNIGFFSARGIADGIGASEIDPDEVIVKQAMLKRCVRAVLLVDSSKWGQVAPYTLIPPEQITHVITTQQASPDLVQYYRKLGTQIDLLPT
jgi:DeoR/GlpR family transcriptional regulator of sugar metabolism